MTRPKALLSWSSGKDSAYALAEVRRADDIEIVGLLTTVSAAYDRVAMHGVRRELLERQAEAAGLPLLAIDLPTPCSNAQYEAALDVALARARADDIVHIIFGDLFLEDIRAYREQQLAAHWMTGVYPLWGRDTRQLARDMIASGLRARLACVDPRHLDRAFAGRVFDSALLDELPATVDPCGERGEFHTFVTHGPMFTKPVDVHLGEVVERDGFVFADLLP
ncbi:MAG: adenine nucleotide alpha hydrolase [Deltaproteobacteria bacterium]|nr:adenine nucleotide alpha hydrolase [Deltaproteobacteria bacterium]